MNECEFEVVPWYSCEEWKDVRQYIFSNASEDWRRAYEQTLVWKSRVSNLPIGIECTIPLLQAQLAQVDHTIDDSYKKSVFNMSIMKFVSVATKGIYRKVFHPRYMTRKTATYRNLPPYLVDLRNEIVHSDSVFGTPLTLKCALEAAFQWIKINYWEVEEQKLHSRNSKKSDNEITKSDSNDEETLSEEEVNEKSFSELRRVAEEFSRALKLPLNSSTNDKLWLKKEAMALKDEINLAFCDSPERCMEVLVQELFYSATMQENIKLLMEEQNKDESKKCFCSCLLPSDLINKISSVMALIRNLQIMNMFITALFNKSETSPDLCKEWILIICNTVHKYPFNKVLKKFICKTHCFRNVFGFIVNLEELVSWKQLIYQLYGLEQEWSTDFGLRLIDMNVTNIVGCNRSRLKRLSDVYIHGLSLSDNKNKNNRNKTNNNNKNNNNNNIKKLTTKKVRTVNDVLAKSKMSSKISYDFLMEICTVMQKEKEVGEIRSVGETTLGLLSHQVKDPNFYLQLIIKPSDSHI